MATSAYEPSSDSSQLLAELFASIGALIALKILLQENLGRGGLAPCCQAIPKGQTWSGRHVLYFPSLGTAVKHCNTVCLFKCKKGHFNVFKWKIIGDKTALFLNGQRFYFLSVTNVFGDEI